jgi:hypothetical protein
VAEHCVIYAACYLDCERARNDLWLQVGGDDHSKVYLNGREVYRNRFGGGITGLDTVGPVVLGKGTNMLLFKVVNEVRGWYGCLRRR